MRDVLRFARKGRTALRLAAEMKAIRSFAAVHVIEEVAEHLPDLARRQGIAEAINAWTQYAEEITFIEVPRDGLQDDRVARVAREDADDVPTAVLVVSLAPCISLSEDPHLVDAGLASPEWLRLALSSRDVGHAAALKELFGLGIVGTGATVVGSGKLIGRAAKSPMGRIGLGAGLVSVYLAVQRSQKTGWRGPKSAGRIITKAISAFFEEAARADARAGRGEGLISEALIPAGEVATEMRILRVLAMADEPMTATAIARSLINEDERLPRSFLREVQEHLVHSPMLRKAGRHAWELQRWEPSEG